MKTFENFGLEGRLTISKIFPNGRKEIVFDQENLITKAAKQFLLTTLYTPSIPSDPINRLRVGTGGNIDAEGLYPKVENPLATNLVNTVLTLNTVVSVDLNNLKVTFLADADQTQANGYLLTEAGLFKTSGAMFNLKNHPGIAKTSEFSVHYEWAIKIL